MTKLEQIVDEVKAQIEADSDRQKKLIEDWLVSSSVEPKSSPVGSENAVRLLQSAVAAANTTWANIYEVRSQILDQIKPKREVLVMPLEAGETRSRARQEEVSSLSEGVDVIEAVRLMRKESEDASIKLAIANEDTRRFLQSRMSSTET